MERSHGQNGTLLTKCVGTLAHSREIVPILRKPRGRQLHSATVQYQAQKSAFEKTRVVLKSPLQPNRMSDLKNESLVVHQFKPTQGRGACACVLSEELLILTSHLVGRYWIPLWILWIYLATYSHFFI